MTCFLDQFVCDVHPKDSNMVPKLAVISFILLSFEDRLLVFLRLTSCLTLLPISWFFDAKKWADYCCLVRNSVLDTTIDGYQCKLLWAKDTALRGTLRLFLKCVQVHQLYRWVLKLIGYSLLTKPQWLFWNCISVGRLCSWKSQLLSLCKYIGTGQIEHCNCFLYGWRFSRLTNIHVVKEKTQIGLCFKHVLI